MYGAYIHNIYTEIGTQALTVLIVSWLTPALGGMTTSLPVLSIVP